MREKPELIGLFIRNAENSGTARADDELAKRVYDPAREELVAAGREV